MRPERDSSLQVAPSVALHLLQPLPHACASLPARDFATRVRYSALACLQVCTGCDTPGDVVSIPGMVSLPKSLPPPYTHMFLLLSRAQPIAMHCTTCSQRVTDGNNEGGVTDGSASEDGVA